MVNKYLFLLFTFLIFTSHAQGVEGFDSTQIEGSDAYYWGKGRSTQQLKAEEMARADLSEKIVTFLYSSKQIQSITTESGGEVSQTDYINAYTKRFSALFMEELKKITVPVDYGFVTWVYIAKSDWEKSQNKLAEKVESLISSANSELSAGQHDQALNLFYKAYLLSYTSPKELNFKSGGGSLRSHAESAIQKMINSLNLIPGKPRPEPGDETAILLPLRIEVAGKPARGIDIYSEQVQNWYEVVDGSIAVTIELPKQPKQQKNFEIKPVFRGEDYLVEIDKRYPLKFSRKVDVDFSGMIKLDFTGAIKNGVLTCEILSEYLNVVDVDWYYGEGKTSKAIILKADAMKYPSLNVKLRVNNLPELEVTKTITNPDWVEPVKEKPKEKVNEKPRDPPVEKEKNKEPPVPVKDTPPAPAPEVASSRNYEAVISSLISVKDHEEGLNALLKQYKEMGWILLGKKSDFNDPSKCHVLVFDTSTGKTLAILEPGVRSRKDLLSGEDIEDMVTKFKGKTPIWFQIL